MDFLSSKQSKAPLPTSKTMSFSNLAPRPYVSPSVKDTRQSGNTYVSAGDISAWRQREEQGKGKSMVSYGLRYGYHILSRPTVCIST